VGEVTGRRWAFRNMNRHGDHATALFECGEGDDTVYLFVRYLVVDYSYLGKGTCLKFETASVMGRNIGIFYSREIEKIEEFLEERGLPKPEIKEIVWL
jgi:hypothetical protein